MKENMNTINTTKYINMLESNSKFSIELVEQYDNEQIEFKIMRKSNNKQVSYFYIHTNDVITNEKLDNTVYEIYYDNDDKMLQFFTIIVVMLQQMTAT